MKQSKRSKRIKRIKRNRHDRRFRLRVARIDMDRIAELDGFKTRKGEGKGEAESNAQAIRCEVTNT